MENLFEEIDEEMPFKLIIALLNANKKGKKWPTQQESGSNSDSDDTGISKKSRDLLKQLRKLCMKSEENAKKILKQSGVRSD